MTEKATAELLKILNSIDSVSDLEHYTYEILKSSYAATFPEYIITHLTKSGFTAAELIQKAQIQRNYGYQILNGTKNPGRNKVISFCLALSLSLNETQRALTLAKENILYAKNKRDSIIIFCIHKKMNVLETNDLLYVLEEELL